MKKKKWYLLVGGLVTCFLLYQGYSVMYASDVHEHHEPKIVGIKKLEKLDISSPTVKDVPGSGTFKLWRDKKGEISLNESPSNIDVTEMVGKQYRPNGEKMELVTFKNGSKAVFSRFEVETPDKGKEKILELIWSSEEGENQTEYHMYFTSKYSKTEVIEIAESAVMGEETYQTPSVEKEQIEKAKSH